MPSYPLASISLTSSLCVALLSLSGCSRPNEQTGATPSSAPLEEKRASSDVCALVSGEELNRILGEKLDKTQKSENASGGFMVSQCLFHMPTYSNSVVISITRSAPGPEGRDPRAFLEEKIEEREKGEGEEKEKPLDLVPGLGDKAIWMGTPVGGILYILKEQFFVTISLGTLKEPAKRREKAVEIGKLVAGRL
ncbi:MAG: hypothetical protein ABIU29_00190 [Chthoniobacterales bacterium]